MHIARWRIQCYGRVQQVGFRYTALRLAGRMNLTGFVRNLPDGSVQMEAQGETAKLRQFLIQLKSQPHLHIESAAIQVLPPVGNESRFCILKDPS